MAWVHEFNADRRIDSFLTLSPAASFSPVGVFTANDAAKVDVGLKYEITNRVALFAYFDGEFSAQGQSYAGNGGIKISW